MVPSRCHMRSHSSAAQRTIALFLRVPRVRPGMAGTCYQGQHQGPLRTGRPSLLTLSVVRILALCATLCIRLTFVIQPSTADDTLSPSGKKNHLSQNTRVTCHHEHRSAQLFFLPISSFVMSLRSGVFAPNVDFLI